MNRDYLPIVALTGLVLAIVPSGCNQKPAHPPTCPVSVTVTTNGQPLEGATVCFISPQSNTSSGSGMSGSDGRVAVTTFERGDGLMAGNYKVTVTKSETRTTPNPKNPNGPPLREEVIWHVPQKFSTVTSTPFSAEVAQGAKNEFTFDVK